MTTVAELAAFLAKLPPDAKVRVLEERCKNYNTFTDWVDLQLPTGDPTTDYTETCSTFNNQLDLGNR